MQNAIYVLLDHRDGQILMPSLEALSVAQHMADQAKFLLHAVILGNELRSVRKQAASMQMESILLVEDSKLADYDVDVHCEVLSQLLKDGPRILLMGHTYQNIDLAPKLAAATNKALVTGCTGFRYDGDGFVFIRQMFRNKLNADIKITSDHPWILTMQSGAGSIDDLKEGAPKIIQRSTDLSTVKPRRKIVEMFEAVKGEIDLTRAKVIVAVGRGIKEAENLGIIEELAEVLGAETAASRPVVDSEWLGRDRQVGSSGQTVTPRLYVACGISGAIQHVVGMKNSNCIVAINSDPNAPIFSIATYGVIGNLFEIIPALTRRLREEKNLRSNLRMD